VTVPSTGPSLRILALGNDILGDDAFAFLVAQRVRERIPGVEVRCSSASGFHLLDDLLGVERLVVVDTVMTGNAPPGTVYVVREGDLEVTPGNSPHYTGIFETLSLARALNLNAPREVLIIAVEAADCLTVGGPMHPAVEAVVPVIAEMVESKSRNFASDFS
jgi:hydrogenase maturation protease